MHLVINIYIPVTIATFPFRSGTLSALHDGYVNVVTSSDQSVILYFRQICTCHLSTVQSASIQQASALNREAEQGQTNPCSRIIFGKFEFTRSLSVNTGPQSQTQSDCHDSCPPFLVHYVQRIASLTHCSHGQA